MEIKEWLNNTNKTEQELDIMWKYLISKNRTVTMLFNEGKDWRDLPIHLVRDIEQCYKKELQV